MINHWLVLNVRRDSSAADIRAAYQSKARETHPDRPGGSVEAFQRVQAAWQALGGPRAVERTVSMALMGRGPCAACRGRGFSKRQVGFDRVLRSACVDCGGSGINNLEKPV